MKKQKKKIMNEIFTKEEIKQNKKLQKKHKTPALSKFNTKNNNE